MKNIAVVIPSYRVTSHVLGVIERIGPEVQSIYVVDDCCPDKSGDFVVQHCSDPRVQVLRHAENLGVGGAVMTGYRQAVLDGMDVVVKIDGDGQMDPALLPGFVQPLLAGRADYTKGNRFFYPADAQRMPIVRLIGNIGLSFFTRMSSGYWSMFDPTNGFTAITKEALSLVELDKIHNQYFFESDLLF
jgi:dolichol-phosphate mannosyltransferase